MPFDLEISHFKFIKFINVLSLHLPPHHFASSRGYHHRPHLPLLLPLLRHPQKMQRWECELKDQNSQSVAHRISVFFNEIRRASLIHFLSFNEPQSESRSLVLRRSGGLDDEGGRKIEKLLVTIQKTASWTEKEMNWSKQRLGS
jgi:hypothetical protein